MLLKKILNSDYSRYRFPFLIITIAFVIWVYCFKGFILGDLALQSDAVAYYEHFEFFIRNLAHGEYPLWESTREQGMPTEFFMRRIGSFNPFFFIILFLFKLALPFQAAYYTFLVLYFFIGMIGFYLLAYRILKDQRAALLAYLLLLFSSLSTRLFDSYFLLTIIPMIWFFYFFLVFIQERLKVSFWGIVFTGMILLTTYIPFYFGMIFATALIFLIIFYTKEFLPTVFAMGNFIRRNKIHVLIGAICLSVALIPGYLFYVESHTGEIVLPERNASVSSKAAMEGPEGSGGSVLEVGISTTTSWGMEEDLFYSTHFMKLERFKFAVVYVPVFALIVFVLGFFYPVSRRLLFLVSWGAALFLMFSPYGPFYNWLFAHLPFFKYFRNLHYFLWMALFPIFILIVAEQFRIFFNEENKRRGSKITAIIFLVLAHAAVAIFSVCSHALNISTLATILVSFIFLVYVVLGKYQLKALASYLIFIGIVAVQPGEAYYNLQKNSDMAYRFRYMGTEPYRKLILPPAKVTQELLEKVKEIVIEPANQELFASSQSQMYIGSKWFSLLQANMNYDLLGNYRSRDLSLYDRIKVVGKDEADVRALQQIWAQNENLAVVSTDQGFSSTPLKSNPSQEMDWINEESVEVNVLNATANTLTLKMNIPDAKFLVQNNNYHSGWRAFVDGKKVPLYRTNITFRGVWVPAGKHIVYFRYGSFGQYFLNYGLLVLFYGVFIFLIRLMIKEKQELFL